MKVIPQAPGVVVAEDLAPLQLPGRDEILSVREHGGPRSGKDYRMVINKDQIKQLQEAADKSASGRAQIDLVGIQTHLMQRTTGSGEKHVYELWILTGKKPKPEVSKAVLTL